MEFDYALIEITNSTPGGDRITYDFIKQAPESTRHVILELYNEIWSNGTHPEMWKEAIIIPLLKLGKDPTSPASYRPISLTSCLSKLLEKMVNLRLRWYLEKTTYYQLLNQGSETIDPQLISYSCWKGQFKTALLTEAI